MIDSNKFLNDAKFYKNNYWSIAAWDSWAAQGQAGGCHTCNVKHYNGTLCNTRASHDLCRHVSGNICTECIAKVETELGYKFNKK